MTLLVLKLFSRFLFPPYQEVVLSVFELCQETERVIFSCCLLFKINGIAFLFGDRTTWFISGSHFSVDLMHRKAEVKATVTDEMRSMIDRDKSIDPSRDGAKPCYRELDNFMHFVYFMIYNSTRLSAGLFLFFDFFLFLVII